jgi:hypothetical protein
VTRRSPASGRRRVQRRQRVGKRRVGPQKPPVEARDLRDAPVDHLRLSQMTWLDLRDVAAYVRCKSARSASAWLDRRGIAKSYGANGRPRVARRDIDAALRPTVE